MRYGHKGDKHDIVHPQYRTWGLFGGKKLENVVALSEAHDISQLLADIGINLEEYIPFANEDARDISPKAVFCTSSRVASTSIKRRSITRDLLNDVHYLGDASLSRSG